MAVSYSCLDSRVPRIGQRPVTAESEDRTRFLKNERQSLSTALKKERAKSARASPCLLCRSKRCRCDCSGTCSGRSADRKCNSAGFERVALDVLVVRKLGMPGHEERAMGAIASGMVRVLNRDVRLRPAKTGEMGRRERQYRDSRILQDLEQKTVILTDDGPATGATMHAAVMSLRQRKIARCSRPTCADRISGTVQTHFARLNQQGGTQPLKYLKNLRLLHGNPSPSMQESRRTT